MNISILLIKLYVERQLGRSTTNEGIEDEKMTSQELRPQTRNSVRTVSLVDCLITGVLCVIPIYVFWKNAALKKFHGGSLEILMQQF
jgi:hypothetical protein